MWLTTESSLHPKLEGVCEPAGKEWESNRDKKWTSGRSIEAANIGHIWNLIPWGCWHWRTFLGMIPLMGDGVCTDMPAPITLVGS